MNLCFVSSGPYPEGGASTNRHLAYAKGLVELGHRVEFILLEEQSWDDRSLIYQGIRFNCIIRRKKKSGSILERVKYLIKVIRITKKTITEDNNVSKISALILLDTSIVILIPLLNLGKKLGIKVFHERTEYPFVVSDRTLLGRLNLFIYLKHVVNRFNGIYVINNTLKHYFSKITKSKVRILVVNMIVDPMRFELEKEASRNGIKTITYCGKLDGDKDGVPLLVEAFSMISEEFPFLRLQLIGSLSGNNSEPSILSLIKKFGIESKVLLTGSLGRDEIPKLLCNSDILALARPNNRQAEGGFPTKLGEYLATGNPVVITNVGEIGKFLKDNFNAFISEPDSARKFANKLRNALLSDDAKKIGLEGKKLIYNEFNYLKQAQIIEELVSEI